MISLQSKGLSRVFLTPEFKSISSLVLSFLYGLTLISIHVMANRWGKMETVTDFLFLGSKITVDSDCSHEIKRHFLLGRKAVTNLDRMLKGKDLC